MQQKKKNLLHRFNTSMQGHLKTESSVMCSKLSPDKQNNRYQKHIEYIEKTIKENNETIEHLEGIVKEQKVRERNYLNKIMNLEERIQEMKQEQDKMKKKGQFLEDELKYKQLQKSINQIEDQLTKNKKSALVNPEQYFKLTNLKQRKHHKRIVSTLVTEEQQKNHHLLTTNQKIYQLAFHPFKSQPSRDNLHEQATQTIFVQKFHKQIQTISLKTEEQEKQKNYQQISAQAMTTELNDMSTQIMAQQKSTEIQTEQYNDSKALIKELQNEIEDKNQMITELEEQYSAKLMDSQQSFNKLNLQIQEIVQVMKEQHKTEIHAFEGKIKINNDQKQILKRQNKDLINKVKKLEGFENHFKDKEKQLISIKELFNQNKINFNQQISELNKKSSNREKQVKEIMESYRKLQEQFDKIKNIKKFDKYVECQLNEEEIDQYKQHIRQLQGQFEVILSEKIQEYEIIKEQFNDCSERNEHIEKQNQELSQEIDTKEEQLTEKRQKLDQINEEITAKDRQIHELYEELCEMREMVEDYQSKELYYKECIDKLSNR